MHVKLVYELSCSAVIFPVTFLIQKFGCLENSISVIHKKMPLEKSVLQTLRLPTMPSTLGLSVHPVRYQIYLRAEVNKTESLEKSLTKLRNFQIVLIITMF